MAAKLKVQDGHHGVFAGSGSCQKGKAVAMCQVWRKFGVFGPERPHPSQIMH